MLAPQRSQRSLRTKALEPFPRSLRRMGDETFNQKRLTEHWLHCTALPALPTPAVILNGRKSAKDLARTTTNVSQQ